MRYFIAIFAIAALSASCHRDDKCCGLQTGITMNGPTLIGSGTYRLTDTPVFSNMSQPVIVFSSGEMTSYNVRIDALFLGEDFDDGFQKTFVPMN